MPQNEISTPRRLIPAGASSNKRVVLRRQQHESQAPEHSDYGALAPLRSRVLKAVGGSNAQPDGVRLATVGQQTAVYPWSLAAPPSVLLPTIPLPSSSASTKMLSKSALSTALALSAATFSSAATVCNGYSEVRTVVIRVWTGAKLFAGRHSYATSSIPASPSSERTTRIPPAIPTSLLTRNTEVSFAGRRFMRVRSRRD